ncbi:MAG TPA: hypothetical protein VK911_09360, partial [Vicinamibacterales bacterium]|nr:hypothetical protein [Vicinamibacterales bacterium]
AQARRLDSPSVHLALILMAWAEGDRDTLRREGDALLGRPGAEEAILMVRQMIALREGAFAEARDLTRAAADAHLRRDQPEGSGRVQVALALAEALVGRTSPARQAADAALARSGGKDVMAGVAVARALSGDTAQASRIAAELDEAFPVHTVVQRNYLPAIQAAVALQKRRPGEAIEALKAAAPYELGRLGYFMLPVYLRGEAFLARGEGGAAATEFRKILDYRGVGLDVVVALARLGLARALAAAGDTPAALAAYEQFLALWRDADPDLPVLRAARKEHAALRGR